jgi:hypothetical protein
MNIDNNFIQNIFSNEAFDFSQTALELFRFQYAHNEVYKNYVDAIGVKPALVRRLEEIPFLPIRFFKTHKIITTAFEPELIFESSGTTQTINSKHYVKNASIYQESFLHGFKRFYGDPESICIIGLLPSYLEREHSSLVYMVDQLIKKSGHRFGGFYLDEFDQLAMMLDTLKNEQQKVLLIGVTFALLDFAQTHPMPLQHVTVMETGGMKGRKEEMLRQQVHEILMHQFQIDAIHSEYGMTELLSQAYSKGNGIFHTPPWMKILIRDEEDPLAIKQIHQQKQIKGIINVIDLANIYSCSFIATDDLGVLHHDNSFEVSGRIDNSDLRGCSLLTI